MLQWIQMADKPLIRTTDTLVAPDTSRRYALDQKISQETRLREADQIRYHPEVAATARPVVVFTATRLPA